MLSGVLPLERVSTEWAGNYTCHVDTPLGSTYILTRQLIVLPPSSAKLNYSGGTYVQRHSVMRFSTSAFIIVLLLILVEKSWTGYDFFRICFGDSKSKFEITS